MITERQELSGHRGGLVRRDAVRVPLPRRFAGDLASGGPYLHCGAGPPE
jgi:hypothetical protein